MKYVSENLTKHHLLHAPHKWFLAALISPIHALEIHYQKRYHLQFAHARKLFLFDMVLLASIFVIGGAGLFWYLYDPTIQNQVTITIKPAPIDTAEISRVPSGGQLLFSLSYKNNSQVELIEPVVHINLPPGVIINQVTGGSYTTSTHSIKIPDIKPKIDGQITLEGQFFGEPNREYQAGVELVYRQDHHDNFEIVFDSILTTLRGSTLTGSITAPTTIFANSQWDGELTIKNNSKTDLENIVVPIVSTDNADYKPGRTTLGKIDNNSWYIPRLATDQIANLLISTTAHVPKNNNALNLEFTPSLIINGNTFNQEKIQTTITVVHPTVEISGQWTEPKASPGDKANLKITLKNSGTIDLKNVAVSIPLPGGIVAMNSINITAKNVPALSLLSSGSSVEIPISIPIVKHPTGSTDLKLILNPKITGTVPGMNQLFETKNELTPLLIGTSLILNTEARYYSPEGDQIGRGPLPPRVGKETKYWALLEVKNGTSAIDSVILTTTLSPDINWTGKTSVSQGREPIYSANDRTVTWNVANLSAYESAHINFELAITPTANEINTTPLLLKNVKVSAWDTFINKTATSFGANIDTSLPSDLLAQKKGVIVQ